MTGVNTRAALHEHLAVGDHDGLCKRVVTWASTGDQHFAWAAHGLPFGASPQALHDGSSGPHGSRRVFGVHELADGPLVGYAELVDIDRPNLTACIGRLIVDPVYRGRGLGSAGVRLLVAEAFRTDLQRVEVRLPVTNQPALRAYRQAGFVIEATLEDAWHRNGEFGSMYLLARTNRVM